MAFQNTPTQFWTANSVKYENVIIGAIKRNTSDFNWNSGEGKQRSKNKAFVLFVYLKLPNKSDLDNLISFSVIYRFIGLRHENNRDICLLH